MGQDFQVVNVDAQEIAPVAGVKLGECIWGSKRDLDVLLLRYWTVDATSMNIWTKKSRAILQSKLSAEASVLRLPNELIQAIFDEIDDLDSIICLCVAHDILGLVGEARLCKLLVPSPNGPWAGDRIICVGENCSSNSFPPDVQDAISAQLAAYAKTPDAPEYPWFYECIEDTYSSHSIPDWRPHRIPWWKWRLSLEDYTKLDEIQRAIYAINVGHNIYNPDLVLCNLTKGVYVRKDAVSEFSAWASLQTDRFLEISLGTLVFIHICWSTDGSCAMHDDLSEGLTQGAWAGDRFEIVTLDKMQQDVEWKDVTEETMAWLRRIAEVDFATS